MKQGNERILRIGSGLSLAGIIFGVLYVLIMVVGGRIGWSENTIAASAFVCCGLALVFIFAGFILRSAGGK